MELHGNYLNICSLLHMCRESNDMNFMTVFLNISQPPHPHLGLTSFYSTQNSHHSVCVSGNENPRARSLLEFICLFTETSGCCKLKLSNCYGCENVRRNCDDGSEIGSRGLRRGLTQMHIPSFVLSSPIVILSRKISELPYGALKDDATIITLTPCLVLEGD